MSYLGFLRGTQGWNVVLKWTMNSKLNTIYMHTSQTIIYQRHKITYNLKNTCKKFCMQIVK